MDAAVLIAGLALGVSAIGFFYKIGQDTRHQSPGADKLDQVLERTKNMDKKLDDISAWQREAASIHASHEERLKTLFNRNESLERRMENVERRMDDREVVNAALQKILEKVS